MEEQTQLKEDEEIFGKSSSDKTEKVEKSIVKVEKRLWNVAKKYKSLFDKGEVPQIAESEEDRMEVWDAYIEIETKRHRQLDSRVYQSLTQMQRTRDAKIALEGTTETDRLRMIAWEVKIRTQAVMFIPGDSTLEMDMFNLHSNNSVRVIDGASKDIVIEDSIINDKGIAILESLPVRKLTKEQKEKMKREFIRKYSGKQFKISEFKTKLNSIEADLVSLLVREKRIVLLRKESQIIAILTYEDYLELLEKENADSQSIVMFPQNKTRKN